MKYENRLLASDIEAIGFYDKVKTKEDIHCLCSIDVETNEVLLFHDNPEFDLQEVFDPYDEKYYTIPKRLGTLEEGIDYWKKATAKGSKLIIHNAHTYDRPVIDKIWPDNGIDFDAYQDTFVESKLQWFERPTPRGCKSPHGLKAYGVLSGVNKPEVTDWDTMDAFKLHRVIEDCKIQAYTYKYLKKERDYLQNKFGINFSVAYKIESMYAAECFEQEVRGAKLNVEGAKKCIADLDDKIDTLTFEIEPYLPLQIKGKSSAKLSKTEIAELFGYCSKNIKDDYVKKKKDGQVVDALVKPYFKPITKWTNVTKGNKYSGFNLSYGDTPSFAKKKELTDWIKENHPETKTKEWDIVKEETKTEVLNTNTCEWFSLDKEDTDKIAGPFTKIEVHETKLTQTDVVKKYLIQLGWKTAEEWNLKKDVYGNFIKVEKKTEVRWPENASPNNQMVHTIEKGGFMVSSPKLSEDDYDQLPEGTGKKIAEYNTYVHRRRFLQNPKDPENKGLISYVREDGRIPCGVNNFGTRSGRASHRVWVNAPSESALYGEEIRKLIIPEEGYSLVGVDMKSAQLSIAAYYANNEEYYNTVATGQEEDEDHNYVGQSAHCVNARMFGMVSDEEWKKAVETQEKGIIKSINLRRKKSKGGSFCLPKDITEVYTKKGWVQFEDIYEGLEILTYNKDKGINEFKPILDIVEFSNRPIISMSNKSWRFESTPEHRWLGKRRTGKGKTRRELEEFIETKDIKSEFKIYNAAKREDIENSLLTPKESAVLGWLLSDGCISWKPYSEKTSSSFGMKRGVKAVIHQGDFKYASIIEDLLKKEDALTGYTEKTSPSGVIKVFNLKADYLRKLFVKANLPFDCKHNINYSSLCNNLSNESLESFIEAFWLADGYTHSGGHKVISQNRGNILNFVVQALMLLGINVSINEKKTNYPTDKVCVDVLFKKKSFTGSTKLKKEFVGDRDVFCVTTENSTFIAKQGDIITITGNCVIFGGSGKKVAGTLGISEKEGNKAKKQFLEQMGLADTIEVLGDFESQYPYKKGFYLPLAFGYWLWNDSPHKSVNTIVQGFEALAQKLAAIRVSKVLKENGLENKAYKIMDYHDELLYEVLYGYEDTVGKIIGDAYTWAAEQIFKDDLKRPNLFPNYNPPKFSIDLNGGYKVGDNYLAVH